MKIGRRRFVRTGCALLAVLWIWLGLVAAPARASEDRPSASPGAGHVLWDLAVLRPLGLVQVAFGAVFFVPAYPAALLFDAGDDIVRICIDGPVDQTFRRPLGEL